MIKKIHMGVMSVVAVILLIVIIYVDKAVTPESSAFEKEQTNSHWSYEGENGPSFWGDLDTEFAVCKEGVNQSPINIFTEAAKSSNKNQNINLNYKPTTLTLVNNGHTIQATPNQLNNELNIGGTQYILQHFHFHAKSEHQLDGEHYPVELHLVHKSAEGKLAVLGVMVNEGNELNSLSTIWDELPQTSSNEISTEHKISIDKLVPENKSRYEYSGSLTTPPCTEGVYWIIFQEPIEMSKVQINLFTNLFPTNNRPVQSTGGREILIFQ
jgi:carbonic anhydrase